MVKLHLVGFTTDLKNLIFATKKGAKRGGYVIPLDDRLLKTLEEVDRIDREARSEAKGQAAAPEVKQPELVVRPSSTLSPKQIQTLLREGKSEDQIAKLAKTDVAWIRKFVSPILAERAGVVESVRVGLISKSRLGLSGLPVGEAIQQNLVAKRVQMSPDQFEDGWKATRKGQRWQVGFGYASRGRRKLARFSFDPETREVKATNSVALEMGWTPNQIRKVRRKAPASPTTRPKVKPRPKARLKAKPRPKARPKARAS